MCTRRTSLMRRWVCVAIPSRAVEMLLSSGVGVSVPNSLQRALAGVPHAFTCIWMCALRPVPLLNARADRPDESVPRVAVTHT